MSLYQLSFFYFSWRTYIPKLIVLCCKIQSLIIHYLLQIWNPEKVDQFIELQK